MLQEFTYYFQNGGGVNSVRRAHAARLNSKPHLAVSIIKGFVHFADERLGLVPTQACIRDRYACFEIPGILWDILSSTDQVALEHGSHNVPIPRQNLLDGVPHHINLSLRPLS